MTCPFLRLPPNSCARGDTPVKLCTTEKLRCVFSNGNTRRPLRSSIGSCLKLPELKSVAAYGNAIHGSTSISSWLRLLTERKMRLKVCVLVRTAISASHWTHENFRPDWTEQTGFYPWRSHCETLMRRWKCSSTPCHRS